MNTNDIDPPDAHVGGANVGAVDVDSRYESATKRPIVSVLLLIVRSASVESATSTAANVESLSVAATTPPSL